MRLILGVLIVTGRALDRFLAEDLQYAHARGKWQTKAEYIAALEAAGSV